MMRPPRGCSRKQNTEQNVIPRILGQYIKVRQWEADGWHGEANVARVPPGEARDPGLVQQGSAWGGAGL